ncbi:MAG: hypothetical protein ACRELB_11825, partial [Polyangiaceae bacterium]
MEQTAWLFPRPVNLPTVEWLGLYPDAIGLAAQGALLLAIVGTSVWFKSRHAVASPAAQGAHVAKS